jgi:hypothetical protein
MKRVFFNILLFLLPLVVLIYLFPFERRQRYIQLKEDCSWHGIWFYDRIHHNDTPVDVAFFGSSHTINGIMDEYIENQLKVSSVHVVNFGYCRYGVNIYPVLLKEVLRSKKPKILFLEVREDENRYSHPVFPYIADASDIFLATPFFNRDLVRDYFNSFLYRLRLLKVQYFKKDSIVPFRTGDFGFMGSKDTASEAFLEKVKLEHMKPKGKPGHLERNFYMTYPRIYLKKLSKLCIENNIRLRFLYIPEYGSRVKEPLEMMTYRKYGDVLIPPREIFEDRDNWGDENHLNRAGAEKLSKWVAGQVSRASCPASPSIP